MALATNTSPGTIVMAGDFQGSRNPYELELTSTDVLSGEYIMPTLVVHNSGRIYLSTNFSTDITDIVSDATTSSKGVVQINDTGLDVAAGVLSVNFTEVADNLRDATNSAKGIISVDNATMDIVGGELSTNIATNTTVGAVKSNDTASISILSGLMDMGSAYVKATDDIDWTGSHSQIPITVIPTGSPLTATPDGSESTMFIVTAESGDTVTIGAITTPIVGQVYTIIIVGQQTANVLIDSAYRISSTPKTWIDWAGAQTALLTCYINSSSDFLCTLKQEFLST